jgi:hypothetical protein
MVLALAVAAIAAAFQATPAGVAGSAASPVALTGTSTASRGKSATALGQVPLTGTAEGAVRRVYAAVPRDSANLVTLLTGTLRLCRLIGIEQGGSPMTDTFYLKRGDTRPSIRLALERTDVSLTGAQVRFQMRARGGAMVLDAPAVIEVATGTPTVRFDWQAADTGTAGLYEAELRVAYPDGTTETFPNSGFVLVRIAEDVRA